jgi:uncharacterized protein YjiS (DUF1127 family)
MNTQQMTIGFQPTMASPAPLGGLARVKRSYPITAPRTADASNDHAFTRKDGHAAELEAWARRATLANGFGDGTAGAARPSADGYTLAVQARADRHAGIAEIIAVVAEAVATRARRGIASWRRAREAHATYRALNGLDARTLRDIGIDRSEMSSVAGEIAGTADRTRVQALNTLRMLSHF